MAIIRNEQENQLQPEVLCVDLSKPCSRCGYAVSFPCIVSERQWQRAQYHPVCAAKFAHALMGEALQLLLPAN